MCTIHANGPRQALSKLRMYAMMAEEGLPTQTVAEMMAEAIHVVVHLRMDAASGRRVVPSIYEVTGLEEGTVTGSELFTLEGGALKWAGIRPRNGERLGAGPFPWDR